MLASVSPPVKCGWRHSQILEKAKYLALTYSQSCKEILRRWLSASSFANPFSQRNYDSAIFTGAPPTGAACASTEGWEHYNEIKSFTKDHSLCNKNYLEVLSAMGVKLDTEDIGEFDNSKMFVIAENVRVDQTTQLLNALYYIRTLFTFTPAISSTFSTFRELEGFQGSAFRIQRRAIRLIGDPVITCHLQLLSHRRAVGDLSSIDIRMDYAPPS
nr:unnamed protein product [Callosobruchus chinensis]